MFAQQTNTLPPVADSSLGRWEKIAVTPEERAAAASSLAVYVRSNSVPPDKAANLLALALAIDPSCKEAIIASFQMQQGTFKPSTGKAVPPEELAKKIDGVADKLQKSSDADSKTVAMHLFFAATILSPSDDDAILGYEGLTSAKNPLNWDAFYTAKSFRPASPVVEENRNRLHVAAKGSDKMPPVKDQSEMKGLYIIDLGMGKAVGKAFDVIATQRSNVDASQDVPDNTDVVAVVDPRVKHPTPPPTPQPPQRPWPYHPNSSTNRPYQPYNTQTNAPTSSDTATDEETPAENLPNFKDAHFSSNKIGWQMRKSLKECYINLMARNPSWGLHNVVISFEDDQTPADGPSATTVFAILMTSMQQGIELDPKVAITGDMSADLNVRPIGGVRSKIMGAMGADCSYVGIPVKNRDDLMDALVLMSPDNSLITKIQVIGLETLEQALTLARKDRPKEFQDTLNEFSTLAPTLPLQGKYTSDQVSTLQDVLKKIPNHLSAKLLLERQEKGWPTTMSLRNSVYELIQFSEPFYDRLHHRERDVVNLEFSSEFYIDLEKRLDTIKPYFDKDAQHLANHFENLVRDWHSLAYKIKNNGAEVGGINSSIQDLNTDLSSFRNDLNKILTDESKRAEIMD